LPICDAEKLKFSRFTYSLVNVHSRTSQPAGSVTRRCPGRTLPLQPSRRSHTPHDNSPASRRAAHLHSVRHAIYGLFSSNVGVCSVQVARTPFSKCPNSVAQSDGDVKGDSLRITTCFCTSQPGTGKG